MLFMLRGSIGQRLRIQQNLDHPAYRSDVKMLLDSGPNWHHFYVPQVSAKTCYHRTFKKTSRKKENFLIVILLENGMLCHIISTGVSRTHVSKIHWGTTAIFNMNRHRAITQACYAFHEGKRNWSCVDHRIRQRDNDYRQVTDLSN